MPIIVYFKTKEEPKKLQFIYDLYLSLDGKPLNNIRCEKLTFHNPPEDFCQKLFRGGAGIKDNSAATAGPVVAVSPAKKPPTPPQKKSPHLAGAPPASSQFCGLFGAPIIKGPDAKVSFPDAKFLCFTLNISLRSGWIMSNSRMELLLRLCISGSSGWEEGQTKGQEGQRLQTRQKRKGRLCQRQRRKT